MTNYTSQIPFSRCYARHFAWGKPWDRPPIGVELDAMAIYRDLAKDTPWASRFSRSWPVKRGLLKNLGRKFDAISGILLNDEKRKRRARFDAEKVSAIFADLPYVFGGSHASFELKVGGLAGLFAYAFFKFGWSYRLFNYCTILFGAIPMMRDTEADVYAAERAAERVIRMNIIAGGHFNEGLRAIFLSIGYLGWFVNAYVFMATTATVVFVLTRRQFFSEARLAIMDVSPPSNLHLSPIPRGDPPLGGNDSSGGV
jgi:hypothetical protein